MEIKHFDLKTNQFLQKTTSRHVFCSVFLLLQMVRVVYFAVLVSIISIIIYFNLIKHIVFYATFNNISVILWRSPLLVGETGVPGENH
jgi:hypothetical protein